MKKPISIALVVASIVIFSGTNLLAAELEFGLFAGVSRVNPGDGWPRWTRRGRTSGAQAVIQAVVQAIVQCWCNRTMLRGALRNLGRRGTFEEPSKDTRRRGTHHWY